MKKMIIDTDCGSDDAIAILPRLLSEKRSGRNNDL
jgi:inosine-uridine nucleoside N-ribohydrolase